MTLKKHIIAVTTAKGGCGKTTAAATLAQAAADAGQRALAIDLDPQKNLSFWYRVPTNGKTSYNVFLDGDIKSAIQKTDFGVDIVPGSNNLIAVKTYRESARRLEKAVDTIKRQYDFIIIDTAPGMGELMNNAIFAAREILIPLQSDIMSVTGLLTIKGIIDQAKTSKPNLSVLGAFVSMIDRRTTADKELLEVVKTYCKRYKVPYLGEVRKCTKVRESMAMQTPLLSYAPRCSAAADFLELFTRIEGEVKA